MRNWKRLVAVFALVWMMSVGVSQAQTAIYWWTCVRSYYGWTLGWQAIANSDGHDPSFCDIISCMQCQFAGVQYY